MLIGALVRALAADAPGLLVEVIPRLADAGRPCSTATSTS
jgi:hypothetical protein